MQCRVWLLVAVCLALRASGDASFNALHAQADSGVPTMLPTMMPTMLPTAAAGNPYPTETSVAASPAEEASYVPESCTCTEGFNHDTACVGVLLQNEAEQAPQELGQQLGQAGRCTLVCPDDHTVFHKYVNTGELHKLSGSATNIQASQTSPESSSEANLDFIRQMTEELDQTDATEVNELKSASEMTSKWIGDCVTLTNADGTKGSEYQEGSKYQPEIFFTTYNAEGNKVTVQLKYQEDDRATNLATNYNREFFGSFSTQSLGAHDASEKGLPVLWTRLSSERVFATLQELVAGDGSLKRTAARVQMMKATVCRETESGEAICAVKKIIMGCQIATCKVEWTVYGGELNCVGTCTQEFAAQGKCQTQHIGTPYAMGTRSNNYVWQEGVLASRTNNCSPRTLKIAAMLS